MLELEGLQVTYGTTVAVASLELSVSDDGATALLGANGAGKTSTLRAISRLIPSRGRDQQTANRLMSTGAAPPLVPAGRRPGRRQAARGGARTGPA